MKERVIALGFFDGVHLGHGALLRRAAEEAALRGCTPAVFTFDRPPKAVVTGCASRRRRVFRSWRRTTRIISLRRMRAFRTC